MDLSKLIDLHNHIVKHPDLTQIQQLNSDADEARVTHSMMVIIDNLMHHLIAQPINNEVEVKETDHIEAGVIANSILKSVSKSTVDYEKLPNEFKHFYEHKTSVAKRPNYVNLDNGDYKVKVISREDQVYLTSLVLNAQIQRTMNHESISAAQYNKLPDDLKYYYTKNPMKNLYEVNKLLKPETELKFI